MLITQEDKDELYDVIYRMFDEAEIDSIEEDALNECLTLIEKAGGRPPQEREGWKN